MRVLVTVTALASCSSPRQVDSTIDSATDEADAQESVDRPEISDSSGASDTVEDAPVLFVDGTESDSTDSLGDAIAARDVVVGLPDSVSIDADLPGLDVVDDATDVEAIDSDVIDLADVNYDTGALDAFSDAIPTGPTVLADGPAWESVFPAGRRVSSSAIAFDDTENAVFLTTVSTAATGFPTFLHSLDVSSGIELFVTEFEGAGETTPSIDDEGCISLVTSVPFYSAGYGAARVYRFSKYGDLLWTRDFSEETPRPGMRSRCPAIAEDGRIFAVVGKSLRGLSPFDGSSLWKTPIDSDPSAFVAPVDSLPEGEDGYHPKALKNRDAASPALQSNRLYLFDEDQELLIVDADSGSVLVSRHIASATRMNALIIAPDGTLIAGSSSGEPGAHQLRAYDPIAGIDVWNGPFRPRANSLVAGSDGTLYVSEPDIHAVVGGVAQWTFTTIDSFLQGMYFETIAGLMWTNASELLVSLTFEKGPYVLVGPPGALLAAPTSVKSPYAFPFPAPPAIVPRPGQLVYAAFDNAAKTPLLVSIPAPVDVPAVGSWSTPNANQRNTRRLP